MSIIMIATTSPFVTQQSFDSIDPAVIVEGSAAYHAAKLLERLATLDDESQVEFTRKNGRTTTLRMMSADEDADNDAIALTEIIEHVSRMFDAVARHKDTHVMSVKVKTCDLSIAFTDENECACDTCSTLRLMAFHSQKLNDVARKEATPQDRADRFYVPRLTFDKFGRVTLSASNEDDVARSLAENADMIAAQADAIAESLRAGIDATMRATKKASRKARKQQRVETRPRVFVKTRLPDVDDETILKRARNRPLKWYENKQ